MSELDASLRLLEDRFVRGVASADEATKFLKLGLEGASGMDVKWLHAPGHAGSINKEVIQYATGLDALVIDWSEMYWNTDELRQHAGGYRHFIGEAKAPDSRGRVPNHDVVISTRSDAAVLHDEEFFVAREFTPNAKYMPARYGKARVVRWNGEIILIIAWHPQPKATKWLGTVLSGYRNSVRRVEKIQKRLVQDYNPTIIFNGGDLQLGRGEKWYYPNQLAERLGLQHKNRTIDWQMWAGARFQDFVILDPAHVNPKMDHKWTLLELVKTSKK